MGSARGAGTGRVGERGGGWMGGGGVEAEAWEFFTLRSNSIF